MNYWANKEVNKNQAVNHIIAMSNQFLNEIKEAVSTSKIYICDRKFSPVARFDNMTICVGSLDSVSAIFKYYSDDTKCAVLNFASYTDPGGKFLQGSMAQEECLCHSSFLYNVLSKFGDYYEWNKQHINKAMYSNRAIYTSDVYFMSGDDLVSCDVLTCAAPNKTRGKNQFSVSNFENTSALRDRIRFILSILAENKAEVIILGAYGSGVFGQNAEEVANIFKTVLLNEFECCFRKVIFAIPNGNGNLDAFLKVFKERGI